MTNNNDSDKSELAHLDEGLLAQITTELGEADVLADSPIDLDEGGMYARGHIVLGGGKLGVFFHSNGAANTTGRRVGKPQGQWRGSWRSVDEIDKAVIVDGLGVSICACSPAAR